MSPLVVVAIDFGTTYSGWAFSYKTDYERDPLKITAQNIPNATLSLKVPTCILIYSDGKTTHSFGYDAEDKYAEICDNGQQHQWFFFKRFKMMLLGEKDLTRRDTLEDETSKKLPAMTVFSLAIEFLRKDVLDTLSRHVDSKFYASEIHWVLTVPAIWNDAAKQFMREAAQQASIPGKNLRICLEPEAASIYCRLLPVSKCTDQEVTSISRFSSGTKYIVLDAGGGTVDIALHQITDNGNIKELHKASGGFWGGTKVDEAFEEFLSSIVGPIVVSSLKRQHLEDYIDIFREFESKKRKPIYSKGFVALRLPTSLFRLCIQFREIDLRELLLQSRYESKVHVSRDKLKIDSDVFKELFAPTVCKIISHVENLLTTLSFHDCAAILMVGGFSESSLLQENVRCTFKNLKVIIPDEAGLAVLKGAVIFGHQTTTITQRICKFTYGTHFTHKYSESCKHRNGRVEKDDNGNLRCYDLFDIHVKAGQSIKLNEEQPESILTPITDDQEFITLKLYSSSSTDPHLTTEDGCSLIGKLRIHISDTSSGRKHEFGIIFIFGGTEIVVKVVDKESGEVMLKSVDFLGYNIT